MPEAGELGADEVARKVFATSFRGYDQQQVRAHLGRAAAALAAAQARVGLLEERLAAAEARAVPLEIGEDELEAALGVEATKVLHAARTAAAEIRAHAQADATKVRDEAAAVLVGTTQQAERAAAATREEAEREAGAALAASEARGRQVVADAQAEREHILRDLARRQRAGHQQLARLRAARDALLEAFGGVRAVLDGVASQLADTAGDARPAGEADDRLVGRDPQPSSADAVAPRQPDDGATAGPEADSVLARHPDDGATAGPEADSVLARHPDDGATAGPEADGVVARHPDDGATAGSEADGVVAPRDDDETATAEREASATAARAGAAVRRRGAGATGEVSVAAARRDAGAADDDGTAAAAAGPDGEGRGAGGGEAADAVDGMFARLRADRAAALARAGEVLTDLATRPARPDAEAGGGTHVPGPVALAAEGGVAAAPEGPDPVAAAFARRDADVAVHERTLARALKRALGDEQNRLLDALRRTRGAPDIDELLPPVTEHERHWAVVAEPAVVAAGAAAASAAAVAPPRPAHAAQDGAGAGTTVAHPGAGSWPAPAVDVRAIAVALGSDVVTALRPRVERALAQGGSECDVTAVSQVVSAAYREWRSSRAEPAARHAVLAAWGAGAFLTAPGGDVEWVVDPSASCSPDCADNALAGPTPKGEPFPTGHRHPPAHPGCRCLLLAATR